MLRNKKQKITILLTFCVALTISSFLFFQLSSLFGVVAINTGEETTDLRLSTTHTSLVEIDDTDPTKDWAFWKAGGLCTGSGTAGDPYVIEDDIFNVAGQCLVIVHSEKHFIVRNCTFNNPGMVETIELWNTTNGIFEDNLLPILWRPFVLVQCGDIIFRNNNFTACGYSILLVNSRDVTIENNWIGGSVFTAIELDNCNDTLINNNDIILGADLCIYIDDSLRTTVTNNLIEDNAIFGVLFVTSNHTTISNNDINENQNYGIYGIFSFHAVVSNNDLFNNTDYGIVFEDMGYSTIDSNTLDYHAGGIALDDSPYNEVTKNTIILAIKCPVIQD